MRCIIAHNDLYIVDNSSPELSVKKYLNDWCAISRQMDIATGYFEIGGLLELDGEWQNLKKIRIILGSEITKRTREIMEDILNAIFNTIENLFIKRRLFIIIKNKNRFLW